MGISNVKTSRDLSSAIYYMLHGKGHDGSSQRYVSTRFENLTLDGAIQQTKAVREHFNKDKNVHGLTFIFSFSDREIFYLDRIQQEKMMDSLHEVMKERFPNRQFGLVGQTDGEGRKFHIHAFVNSPDLTTGKLLDGRVKLHEHSKEMLTEAMNKANIQDLNKDVEVKQARKTNIAVQKIKSKNPNSYIWLEDLQNRISKALNDKNVINTKQLEERMLKVGVTVEVRKSNKTKTGHALSYKFRDENGKERKIRAGRLGTDFQFENIQSVILNHRALLQAEEEEAKRRQEDEARREYVQKQISRISEARNKSIQKPVSEPQASKPVQKQISRLSEARRTNSETQTSKSIQKPVEAKIEQNRTVSESPLLKYIKTNKFVMWSKNGIPFKSLKNERQTFKEHMELMAQKDLSDEELLKFAKTIEFTVPFPNWEGKLTCTNSKAETLSERFDKSLSDDDLLKRVRALEQEHQLKQKQSTIDFER